MHEFKRGDQFVRIDRWRTTAEIDVAEAESPLVVKADLAAQRLEVAAGLRFVVAHAVDG